MCLYVCVCVHACVHVCVSVFLYVYECVCLCVCMCVRTRTCEVGTHARLNSHEAEIGLGCLY